MKKITVEVKIKGSIDEVWNKLNNPTDIMNWNFAFPDWHCPSADNDLRVGGLLKSTMAAKDGSFAFTFEGTYDEIIPNNYIKYHLSDNRAVAITMKQEKDHVFLSQTFDAEDQNSIEMQQQGWQAILNNFKNYVEHNI